MIITLSIWSILFQIALSQDCSNTENHVPVCQNNFIPSKWMYSVIGDDVGTGCQCKIILNSADASFHSVTITSSTTSPADCGYSVSNPKIESDTFNCAESVSNSLKSGDMILLTITGTNSPTSTTGLCISASVGTNITKECFPITTTMTSTTISPSTTSTTTTATTERHPPSSITSSSPASSSLSAGTTSSQSLDSDSLTDSVTDSSPVSSSPSSTAPELTTFPLTSSTTSMSDPPSTYISSTIHSTPETTFQATLPSETTTFTTTLPNEATHSLTPLPIETLPSTTTLPKEITLPSEIIHSTSALPKETVPPRTTHSTTTLPDTASLETAETTTLPPGTPHSSTTFPSEITETKYHTPSLPPETTPETTFKSTSLETFQSDLKASTASNEQTHSISRSSTKSIMTFKTSDSSEAISSTSTKTSMPSVSSLSSETTFPVITTLTTGEAVHNKLTTKPLPLPSSSSLPFTSERNTSATPLMGTTVTTEAISTKPILKVSGSQDGNITDDLPFIVTACVGFIVILTVIIILIYCLRRKGRKQLVEGIDSPSDTTDSYCSGSQLGRLVMLNSSLCVRVPNPTKGRTGIPNPAFYDAHSPQILPVHKLKGQRYIEVESDKVNLKNENAFGTKAFDNVAGVNAFGRQTQTRTIDFGHEDEDV